MLAVAVNNDHRILCYINCSKLKSNTPENTENILSGIKIKQIFLNGAQQLSSNYFKFQYIEIMLNDKSIYLHAGKVRVLGMCLYDNSFKHMLFIFPK